MILATPRQARFAVSRFYTIWARTAEWVHVQVTRLESSRVHFQYIEPYWDKRTRTWVPQIKRDYIGRSEIVSAVEYRD